MERLKKGYFVSRRKKTLTTRTRVKKKKKKPTPYTSDDVPSLPHDLLVMIVARVPILYYRTLSLVSKSLRSMVASPELYKVRSLLGLTESCLYVCLRLGFGYEWYTLSSKRSGGYVLADDDSPCFMYFGFPDFVAVGSDIYSIASSVSILDFKSHMWRMAPSMPMELELPSAIVHDRNIFVLERHYQQDVPWRNSLQVFNTNTQTWDIPWCVLDLASHTFTIDGNLHAVKMMVFWCRDFSISQCHEETVYCAEIALERRKGDRWGKLEWYGGVLTVLTGTQLVKVLSVTL